MRPCSGLDEFEDLGDWLQLREQLEVEIFLVLGEGFDRHVEAEHLVEVGNDFGNGLATPGIEEIFREGAAPFGERLFPGDVMQRHGVGDGAVTVEEVRAEEAWREVQFHALVELLIGLMRLKMDGPRQRTEMARYSC